ncbi:hypothetical protein CJ255_05315 [Candidatus Viridilinea mediisalina]|uniref:Uncharacterized protein n=2 Tax=Candidatus Viridilinea mediisalina TaxID=2024553 RepID=A0A2A6RM18_9CHLR|nr:hypothetical protein CJ255_05315 [Candidatus Viridilinea mediisalina]
MPDWLRKFLKLDWEMPANQSSLREFPRAPATSTRPTQNLEDYAPAQTAVASYEPAQVAAAPSYTPPAQPAWKPVRMDGPINFRTSQPKPKDAAKGEAAEEQSEPAEVRFVGPTSRAEPPTRLDTNGNPVPVEGYVQPVSYMVRGFVRGALPPQGLEQFTREVRATATDVWNFYSYWTRFQTDDFVRFGRSVVTNIVESLPSPAGISAPHAGRIRRAIKVNAPNGNGGDKKHKPAAEE